MQGKDHETERKRRCKGRTQKPNRNRRQEVRGSTQGGTLYLVIPPSRKDKTNHDLSHIFICVTHGGMLRRAQCHRVLNSHT